ncbi:PH domain-containing protein [Halobacillus sp. KGW1]|uniref:PH domain-containing protein n=1 Tax=Halobacillus sp. KGW1 TaxID=1793726 RepID=UPI0007837C62|nr:PH domain-containing protein [Halobacillus sp. KGW1]
MEQQLRRVISEKALFIWRIHGGIQAFLLFLICIALSTAVYFWQWPVWLVFTGAGTLLLHVVLMIWLIPVWRWRRWKYHVSEKDIDIQHGIFIVTRTLIPMVRVQHVDTEQGPLLRKFGVSTIRISTAATVHKIPALDQKEAERLRLSISALARVAEDDV